ncbi:NUDIX hydrolase [Lactococcus cremoris]
MIKIIQLLESSNYELRGKINPDLQLSASALVFKEDKLFFIEHPYQKELLLPAGHVELKESPLDTAIREFHEETGFFAKKMGKLVDVNLIDIHLMKQKMKKNISTLIFAISWSWKNKKLSLRATFFSP